MSENQITIMIISTIPDLIAEHYYFIRNVFPELRQRCKSFGISLDYNDLFFSMTDEEFIHCRSIRKYFESIDLDRTFFICFRGQKLGCIPTPSDIDKMTLDQYPELVDYIGDISFTELTILHALHPFDRFDDGESHFLNPVRHSLFYFKNEDYLEGLSNSQMQLYTCHEDCEEEFVRDLKLAMAKDLVFNDKMEFENKKDSIAHISIRKYEGLWDDDVDLNDMLAEYTREYANLKGLPFDDLMELSDKLNLQGFKGSFIDFRCEGKPLSEVMIEDFLDELKLER